MNGQVDMLMPKPMCEVRGKLLGVGSFLPTCEFPKSDLGHYIWWIANIICCIILPVYVCVNYSSVQLSKYYHYFIYIFFPTMRIHWVRKTVVQSSMQKESSPLEWVAQI